MNTLPELEPFPTAVEPATPEHPTTSRQLTLDGAVNDPGASLAVPSLLARPRDTGATTMEEGRSGLVTFP